MHGEPRYQSYRHALRQSPPQPSDCGYSGTGLRSRVWGRSPGGGGVPLPIQAMIAPLVSPSVPPARNNTTPNMRQPAPANRHIPSPSHVSTRQITAGSRNRKNPQKTTTWASVLNRMVAAGAGRASRPCLKFAKSQITTALRGAISTPDRAETSGREASARLPTAPARVPARSM